MHWRWCLHWPAGGLMAAATCSSKTRPDQLVFACHKPFSSWTWHQSFLFVFLFKASLPKMTNSIIILNSTITKKEYSFTKKEYRHPSTSPLKAEMQYSEWRSELSPTSAMHLRNSVHFWCPDSVILKSSQWLSSHLSHIAVILCSCQPFLERCAHPPEKLNKTEWGMMSFE